MVGLGNTAASLFEQFVWIAAQNLDFHGASSTTNSAPHCTWPGTRHQCCRVYNPLPVPTNWFGMALNVADPPRGPANGVEVGWCRGWLEKI